MARLALVLETVLLLVWATCVGPRVDGSSSPVPILTPGPTPVGAVDGGPPRPSHVPGALVPPPWTEEQARSFSDEFAVRLPAGARPLPPLFVPFAYVRDGERDSVRCASYSRGFATDLVAPTVAALRERIVDRLYRLSLDVDPDTVARPTPDGRNLYLTLVAGRPDRRGQHEPSVSAGRLDVSPWSGAKVDARYAIAFTVTQGCGLQ